jgi:transcriptional regulator with XRE-family HTH domain
MKNMTDELAGLSPELAALLAKTPKVSDLNLTKLEVAVKGLDDDPAWRADYLKSLFVAKIREAMEEAGIAQTEIAQNWGKSRQYVSKLLAQDKRVNFTIETLCYLAHFVNRRLEVQVLRPAETATIVRTLPSAQIFRSPEEIAWDVPCEPNKEFRAALDQNFVRDFRPALPQEAREEELHDTCLAA